MELYTKVAQTLFTGQPLFQIGSIPACAGNGKVQIPRTGKLKVYPRVRGERVDRQALAL